MSGKTHYCGLADVELLSMIIRCTFHSRYDDNNIFHFLATEALFIVDEIKYKNWKKVKLWIGHLIGLLIGLLIKYMKLLFLLIKMCLIKINIF